MRVPTVPVDGVPTPLPDGVTVVDVREDQEYAAGHIDGAFHLPLHDLPRRLGEIPDGQLLVVCRIGARSAQAVAYLVQHGHDAVNLGGGMLDWEEAGRPLVSESGAPPYVA